MKRKKLKDIQQSGFKVPKDYFKSFEDSLMSQVNLKEKVSDAGFNVPDNYFETIEDKILNKVTQKETGKVISLINRKSIIYVSSIAASIVLIFSIFNKSTEPRFDDLEFTSIENYLSEEDINSLDIAALLSDDELSSENFIDSNINEDLLENYLLQNTSIEDLIIE